MRAHVSVTTRDREQTSSRAFAARGPRAAQVTSIIGGTILGALALQYLIFRNGGWVYDDNTLTILARQAGLTWKWLDTPIYQHWDIAMNAIYVALAQLFPLDYRWALAAMLVVLGGAIWCFARLVGLLGLRGWLTVAATIWFALSILWIRQVQWWAAGVQQIPALLFDLICVYAFFRFEIDGRRRWILLSASALAGALLFYEKPALVVVYLALARVLLMSERFSPRAIARIFWSERGLWLSYLAVVGLWGYGYLSSGAIDSASFGHVSLSQYLTYFRIMWVNTLVPALGGFTLPAANLSAGQAIAAGAAQLAFVAIVAVSVRRRRRAWRAWAFLAIPVLLDGAIVAHSRIAMFGAGIGNDLRYLTDFSWLVPVALCAAFGTGRVLQPAVPPSFDRIGLPAPRSAKGRFGRITVAAVLCAYCAGALATSSHLQAGWGSVNARHWEANVERGFAQLTRAQQVPVVADATVPFQIVGNGFAPLNRLSYVLPLYAHGFRIGGPLTGPPVVVAPDGSVEPATIAQPTPPPTASALLRARRLRVPRGAGFVHGPDVCVAPGGAGARLWWRPTSSARGPGPYYLDLGYTTARPSALAILANTSATAPDWTQLGLVIAPYAHTSIAWFYGGYPKVVELVFGPHTNTCIRRLDVVTLTPTPA